MKKVVLQGTSRWLRAEKKVTLLTLLLTAALLLASCGGGQQQQQENQGQQQQGKQDKPKSVQLAAVLESPKRYYGQRIKVGGVVAQVIEPPAFVIVRRQALQDGPLSENALAEKGLLVINAGDTPPNLTERQSVRVKGKLKRNFDVERFESNHQGVELDDALYKEYAGKPELSANRVTQRVRESQSEQTTRSERTAQ